MAEERRRGESGRDYEKRSKAVSGAERATSAGDKESQHAPWRKMWSKETGKKYGIATASEYNKWLSAKRKSMAAAKNKGQTAKKQGDALAPKKKE